MQVKALAENLLDELYTSKMKTKEEEETKSSIWDLKNALPNTNPRTVERYEGGTLYFLLYSLYKTNRFNVALGLFSDRSQRRQNVVKTSVTDLPVARVPLLCFYHILTSSVIYY